MGAYAVAGPSLALTKYWGKQPEGRNIPATPSIAITLGELRSVTKVELLPGDTPAASDRLRLNGIDQDPGQVAPLLGAVRRRTGYVGSFTVHSVNNFPTAAGLASSASGMAALAKASTAAVAALNPGDPGVTDRELSEIARQGSGSAARSVFGGFVELPAGAAAATPLFGPDHWPSFRIIAIALHTGAKPISSREAMNRTAATSPYYADWVADAPLLTKAAISAVERRDLPALGEIARRSYMRMFATMLGAAPPILYWRPESVALIHLLEKLRQTGMPVWETMDAGPQVKVLIEQEHVARFLAALTDELPEATPTVCSAGGGAGLITAEELTTEERRVLEASA